MFCVIWYKIRAGLITDSKSQVADMSASKQAIPVPVVLQNHELRLQRVEAALDLDEDKSVSKLSVVPPVEVLRPQVAAPSQRTGGSSSSRTAELARKRGGGAEKGGSASAGGAATRGASGAGNVVMSAREMHPQVPSFDYLKGRNAHGGMSSAESVADTSAVSEEVGELRTQLGDVDARSSEMRRELDSVSKTLMLVSRENIELRQELRRVDTQRAAMEKTLAEVQEKLDALLSGQNE